MLLLVIRTSACTSSNYHDSKIFVISTIIDVMRLYCDAPTPTTTTMKTDRVQVCQRPFALPTQAACTKQIVQHDETSFYFYSSLTFNLISIIIILNYFYLYKFVVTSFYGQYHLASTIEVQILCCCCTDAVPIIIMIHFF